MTLSKPALADQFSGEDFRQRALLAQQNPIEFEAGDHLLNNSALPLTGKLQLRNAAVLIAAINHRDGASLLLTQRTTKLRSHSGQVAFPGGKIDASDASAEDAALRETEEEIGLARERIELLGRLPDYATGSGYRITPILAQVEPGFTLDLNPDEVDCSFEVPLSFLMDPSNHAKESLIYENKRRYFYEMPYGKHRIWGITAGIIRILYERLYV